MEEIMHKLKIDKKKVIELFKVKENSKKVTQKELADKLEITQATLINIFSKNYDWLKPSVRNLLTTLDVGIADILSEENDIERESERKINKLIVIKPNNNELDYVEYFLKNNYRVNLIGKFKKNAINGNKKNLIIWQTIDDIQIKKKKEAELLIGRINENELKNLNEFYNFKGIFVLDSLIKINNYLQENKYHKDYNHYLYTKEKIESIERFFEYKKNRNHIETGITIFKGDLINFELIQNLLSKGEKVIIISDDRSKDFEEKNKELLKNINYSYFKTTNDLINSLRKNEVIKTFYIDSSYRNWDYELNSYFNINELRIEEPNLFKTNRINFEGLDKSSLNHLDIRYIHNKNITLYFKGKLFEKLEIKK